VPFDRRHPEQEDKKVCPGDYRIVIAPNKREVAPHPARDTVRAKQAKKPERAQKAEALSSDRNQE
jgi:hypothetical protein